MRDTHRGTWPDLSRAAPSRHPAGARTRRRALNTSLVVIVGATGTGKSQLSLELASALARRGRSAEVVSADAMQLYRGMDIGTAKLSFDDRRRIPHHLLDVLDPLEEASVARYQAAARAAIEQIQARDAVPILVGGSGLYVSSVIQDFRFPGTDAVIRARLEAELEVSGPGELHRRLAARDPGAAEAIGPHNGRRLVRALEVLELTGEEFGSGLPETGELWHPAVIIGLQAHRDALVPKLAERVKTMWGLGLLEEVRALQKHGLGATASRAIGYAQAIAQLAGELDEEQAMQATAVLTRRYARRQVGWFKRYRNVNWLDFDDPDRLATALRLVVSED